MSYMYAGSTHEEVPYDPEFPQGPYPVKPMSEEAEVKIDWSPATEDQLAELYDALYERNGRLSHYLEEAHFRINGPRLAKAFAFREEMLRISKQLADSVFAEIQRRAKPEEIKFLP